MARRMSDSRFQCEQMAGRYQPHVEPFNRMVDELRADGEWLPYVAPLYGGVDARILAILRDPGPKTIDSGMLSIENNDASAARYHGFLTEAGIAFGDLLAWNAYPWYINRRPETMELERGLRVLHRVIELCPRLEVIMLHGGDARKAWRMYGQRYAVAAALHVVETYHTSRQALRHADPTVRQEREDKLRASFAEAAAVLYPTRQQHDPSHLP